MNKMGKVILRQSSGKPNSEWTHVSQREGKKACGREPIRTNDVLIGGVFEKEER